MGHMNVMWYVGKFDEASWQLLPASDSPPRAFATNASAWRPSSSASSQARAVRRRRGHRPSALLEVEETSLRFTHEMRNDETWDVAAATVIVAVHLDMATKRPRALPFDVRERAAVVVCRTCGVDERDNPDHQLEMAGARADSSFSFDRSYETEGQNDEAVTTHADSTVGASWQPVRQRGDRLAAAGQLDAPLYLRRSLPPRPGAGRGASRPAACAPAIAWRR